MNAGVLRFEGRTHREVEQLLPWLVNDTLDIDERTLVTQHLDQCRQCQHTLIELQEWQGLIQLESSVPTDPALNWDRLRHRLAVSRRQENSLEGRSTGRGWRQFPPWLRWTLAAQMVAVLVSVSVLGLGWWPPHAQSETYRTLGASSSPLTFSNTLVIVFDAQISEAQLRRLLRENQARIVDGPNDAGAYVIEVPQIRRDRIRVALQAAPGVRLVESLAPEANP